MSTLKSRTDGWLATPSLEALAYVLRHPETWPGDFRWDYTRCSTCAVGLAHRLWEARRPYYSVDAAAYDFGLGARDAVAIFIDTKSKPWLPWFFQTSASVKPKHVAREIDRYLRRRG